MPQQPRRTLCARTAWECPPTAALGCSSAPRAARSRPPLRSDSTGRGRSRWAGGGSARCLRGPITNSRRNQYELCPLPSYLRV
eukprot:4902189-Pyramimonas_sp.AAC.2